MLVDAAGQAARGGGLTADTALRAIKVVDQELFDRTARLHAPTLDRAMPRLSHAANHSGLWVVAAGLLFAFGGRRGRRAAVRGLSSVAVASLSANVIGKSWVGRSRPVLEQVPAGRRVRRIPVTTSFPSGHAASAAAFATGVAREFPAAAVPLGALAAAVAYSRVYTGAHYPSDVAAGAALGVGVGLASTRVWPHKRPVRGARRRRR
jgi:membrane-associated phospholipid phosphatase